MSDALNALKEAVAARAFISGKNEVILSRGKRASWTFDFKKILLEPAILDSYTQSFFERYPDPSSIQVGGLEVGAVPLIAAIVQKSVERGTPLSGFFIRKSRKKGDRMNAIEGNIHPDKKIILVDDILHGGRSALYQAEVLNAIGFSASELFVILRYRPVEAYAHLLARGMSIASLFELNDLSGRLPVSTMTWEAPRQIREPFELVWKFSSEGPNFSYVLPKSAPLADEQCVYFGSDSGVFWCLSQKDGSVVWKYQVPFGASGKYIFSSPALSGELVIFGAYDGNVYALDRKTGKKVWTYWDADWVGSSPCVASDLGLVFIGLEFGLLRKRGAVAALDVKTGQEKWRYTMPEYTHASPAYSKAHGVVICGNNDGCVYGLHAKSGALLWKLQTEGEIKYGVALSEDSGLFAVGSHDGNLYVAQRETGEIVARFTTNSAIYSTPLFNGTRIFVSSTDKHVYCFDVAKKMLLWRFDAGARVFGSPVMIAGSVYVGTNSGKLHELTPDTGEETGVLQLSERIVNAPAYNQETRMFFIPTVANELYAARIKTFKNERPL